MPQMETLEPGKTQPTFKLTSSAFADGASIPNRYTADGANVSPPLSWGAPPAGTESFALICEDPDAPSGLFVHWIAWNLPADSRGLVEGESQAKGRRFREGTNGFGREGWGGPSPPPGKPHRYVFRVLALDHAPTLRAGAPRAELEGELQGHVLGEGVLTGRYGR